MDKSLVQGTESSTERAVKRGLGSTREGRSQGLPGLGKKSGSHSKYNGTLGSHRRVLNCSVMPWFILFKKNILATLWRMDCPITQVGTG